MKKHEVRDKRRLIKKDSTKVTITNKNDKRISSSSRVCCICGKQLSKMNYTNGVVSAKVDHYHIKYGSLLYLDMCKNISSCYNQLEKRGELE